MVDKTDAHQWDLEDDARCEAAASGSQIELERSAQPHRKQIMTTARAATRKIIFILDHLQDLLKEHEMPRHDKLQKSMRERPWDGMLNRN